MSEEEKKRIIEHFEKLLKMAHQGDLQAKHTAIAMQKRYYDILNIFAYF